MVRLSLLCLLLGVVYSFTHDGSATFYHPSAITGTVSFMKNATNGYVTVSVSGSGVNMDNYKLRVYDFTADYGKKDACGLIGGLWNPTDKSSSTAACTTDVPSNCKQGELDAMYGSVSAMNGVTSTYTVTQELVGRSAVLIDSNGDIYACAPIILSGAATFLRAKITEKYNVNGEVNMQITGSKIVTNTNLLRDGGRYISHLQASTNTRSVQGSCNNRVGETTIASFGNTAWSTKQDVQVTTRTGSQPTNLVVREAWTVIGGWTYGNRICAPIYKIAARSASAAFDQNGVSGTVSFTQASPYHPVVIKRNFAFASDSYINSASISDYAVPVFANSEMTKDEICSADWPKGTTLETSALDESAFSTTGFTLYGVNSVIGKALVFETINTTFCANIRNTANSKRFVADFHGNLGGEITLEQDLNDPNSDTTIYNGLYSAGSYTNDVRMILNSNTAPTSEASVLDSRCGSTTVFYPDNTASSSNDIQSDSSCNVADFAYDCKQGVTYSRIGNLAIRTIVNKIKLVRVMTDPYMALTGSYAIPKALRLTWVNTANGNSAASTLDCANLKELPDIYAKAVVTSNARSVYAADVDIKFVQYKMKNPDNMDVEMSFTDVLTLTKSLTVRENPIPNSESGYPYLTCNADLLGGIMNQNDGRLQKVVGWSDFEYAAGSLSAKYSVFSGSSSRNLNKNIVSDNFDFYNKKDSPLYRSIRMGYGEDDDDYVCANINPYVAGGVGFSETKLYAVFSGMESELSGQISMKQLSHTSSTRGTYMFPTNVQSYLTHANHSNWITDTHRVYITKHTSCADIVDKKIDLSTDLFNPYSLSAQYVHNEQYPHFSQVGDVTSKAGVFTSLGKRTFANVDNLPLSGTFGVAGKAIVVSSSTNEEYLGCTILQSTLVNSGATLTVSVVVMCATALFNLF